MKQSNLERVLFSSLDRFVGVIVVGSSRTFYVIGSSTSRIWTNNTKLSLAIWLQIVGNSIMELRGCEEMFFLSLFVSLVYLPPCESLNFLRRRNYFHSL